jgi:hypothetical protein
MYGQGTGHRRAGVLPGERHRGQQGTREGDAPYHRKCEEKPMLRQFGKTVGGVLAVLCLVSTVAVAAEMTCTASDGKGNCTAAAGPDGKVVVGVGEGIKVGEKMDCVDKGGVLECIAKR